MPAYPLLALPLPFRDRVREVLTYLGRGYVLGAPVAWLPSSPMVYGVRGLFDGHGCEAAEEASGRRLGAERSPFICDLGCRNGALRARIAQLEVRLNGRR
jgi:hypothetical protein